MKVVHGISARISVLLLPAALLTGCGYSTGELLPNGVQKIAVQAFGNDTRYRRHEITLTQEVSKQLVRRAGVQIRPMGEAEAVLRGEILEIPRLTLVEDENDRILEGAILAAVRVHFEDARTGAPIVEPFNVTRRAEYIVRRGESLDRAIDEAVRDCAEDIVHRLESHSFLRQREAITK